MPPISRFPVKNVLRRYSTQKCNKKQQENVVTCSVDECMVNPAAPEPSVVIIGAGIAGLSAAQRLIQCGISNFTVLEATDR